MSNTYFCKKCKANIPNSYPFFEDFGICFDCALDLAEEVLKMNIGGGGVFWLKSIEENLYKRFRKTRSVLPNRLRMEVLKKYKFLCQNCGSNKNLSVDHIKPFSKGGSDKPSNLTILCKPCNSRKGNKYQNGPA